MPRFIFYLAAFLLLPALAHAQDISGQWQGTLRQNGRDYRTVLRIETAADGSRHARYFSLDEDPDAIVADPVTLDGKVLKFSVPRMGASYIGTLGADGKTISGTFTQGQGVPLTLAHATKATAWVIDASPHRARFVTVDRNVDLEVLDWGGSGRPLVFLAGLGNTAHEFDPLAPKFTANHHVYAISRRGYGASSVPDPEHGDYSARRLGDDVVAAIDALKLDRPVLAGHSFAGEELSAVANHHPGKVSGLIYLDAGYAYAYYTPGGVVPAGFNLLLSADAVRRDLATAYSNLTAASLHRLGTDLAAMQADIAAAQPVLGAMKAPAQAQPRNLNDRLATAMTMGIEKFTAIPGPVLAFFAVTPKLAADTPAAQRTQLLAQGALQAKQADAFAAGVPNARVIRLTDAAHRIWLSNETEVVREMNAFMANLK